MKITKIEKKKTLHTYDIEVDNEHHYILDNGCVSHNSSVVSNATNGIEPPRSLVTYKKSKKGAPTQVVPDIEKIGQYYTTAFDMESNEGYINLCAVIQKYVDQAISANLYYNPNKYEDGNLPISVVMEDIFRHYSLGGKTIYYSNTDDGNIDTNAGDDKEETKEEKVEDKVEETIVVEEVKNDTMDFLSMESEGGDCAGGACTL